MNRAIPSKLPYPAIDLVPHRDSMLLINELTEYGDDFGSSDLLIKENNLFIEKDGKLDPVVFTEFLAQLTAAHSGFESILKNSKKKVGFLVGISDFHIFQTAQAGDLIRLHIQRNTTIDPVSYVTGNVFRGKERLAEGTLKLWEQETLEQYLDKPESISSPPKEYNYTGENLKGVVENAVLHKAILENLISFQVSENKSEVTADLFFDENFIGFHGHFPNYPVFPGVMMFSIGMVLSRLALGIPLIVTKIRQAKFSKAVVQNMLMQAKINISREEKNFNLNIKIFHAGTICSKISLTAVKQHY